MPELPEVETVRNTLKKFVVNKKISDVDIIWDNTIDGDSNDFKKKIINQTILDIERYGKFLVFILDDYALISHLRMEGKFFLNEDYDKKIDVNYKHVRVIFKFIDNSSMLYHDVRKFGKFKLLDKKNYLDVPPLSNLGKEPWDIDEKEFYEKIKNSKKPIKQLLLDQHVIAGLGNIYANEVCFKCNIHPSTITNTLTKKQIEDVVKYSIEVLEFAIKLGGTTIRSYTSSLGVTGLFQNELTVHGQTECKACKSKIEKLKIGGRMAYFCPKCQGEINEN